MDKKNLPEFLHKKFLSENKIEVENLSVELQEMVKIFEDFLSDITKPDHQEDAEVLNKLIELDKDIYDHALTEFEFNLQYCEACEEEPKPRKEPTPIEPSVKSEQPQYAKGDLVEITGGKPSFIGEVGRVLSYHTSKGENTQDTVTLSSNKFPEGKAVYQVRHLQHTEKKPSAEEATGDEKILDNLMTIGRTKKIGRSALKEMGLKTELGGFQKVFTIGQYQLKRSTGYPFHYVYDLVKQPPKTNAQ